MAWANPKTNWGQPGQTVPGADDFNRIEENIKIIGQYDRAPGYGVASGTNAKTITLSPAPGSYYEGLCFAFKNITENTGAVTINVNGLGAKSIKKPNGNDIAAGNLKAGSIYTVRYNGTNFILQGEGGEYGTAQPEHVLEGYTIGTEQGVVVGTMPDRGAVTNTITAQGGSYTIPQGYHNGSGKVTANFANLVAENIKKGVNIGGVVGECVPLTNEKKWASGTVTKTIFENGYTTIAVTGLAFQPSFLAIRCIADRSGASPELYVSEPASMFVLGGTKYIKGGSFKKWSYVSVVILGATETQCFFTATGWQMDVFNYDKDHRYTDATFEWIAIE